MLQKCYLSVTSAALSSGLSADIRMYIPALVSIRREVFENVNDMEQWSSEMERLHPDDIVGNYGAGYAGDWDAKQCKQATSSRTHH